MRKLIILIGIILISVNLQAQDCYTVREITNKTQNESLSSKKYIFGVKQMTEEILSQKYSICVDGKTVNVNILSIEAPTVGINIGPFMIRKKETIVKTEIQFDGNSYVGEGSSKLSVKATFAELRDENLPFEKSVFASAIKKSLQDAVYKVK